MFFQYHNNVRTDHNVCTLFPKNPSMHCWRVGEFTCLEYLCVFFASLGVEASRLTGRRENGGAVGGIFGHS